MRNLVVLGGGYGGLAVIEELLKNDLPDDVRIILVDRMPYQGLKTEYYALAAGTSSDIELRAPFPEDSRVTKRYGEVSDIVLDNRTIHFQSGDPLSYDYLVIALGCTDQYHGIPGAQEFTCSIQSFSSTRTTYRNIGDIRPFGQVTIIGGGLSGVELAAELRESRGDLNVRICDRGASILSPFPAKAQRYVREWFQKNDIEMKSRVSVSRVEPGTVYNQEEHIYTDVTVWTAGIQPSPVVQRLNLPKDGSGRVMLNDYHQVPLHPELFVVGDCASLRFSPSAQAAMAQGNQIAEVLRAIWSNETPNLGTIKLKGVLGSLGKKSGFGLMGDRRCRHGTQAVEKRSVMEIQTSFRINLKRK